MSGIQLGKTARHNGGRLFLKQKKVTKRVAFCLTFECQIRTGENSSSNLKIAFKFSGPFTGQVDFMRSVTNQTVGSAYVTDLKGMQRPQKPGGGIFT